MGMKLYQVAFYGAFAYYNKRFTSRHGAIAYAKRTQEKHRCQVDVWHDGKRIYG